MTVVAWLAVGSSAVALVAVLLHWYVFGRSLPKVNGRILVKGARATIEILRDEWGVPHIFAKSAADASFGLGFCHAQDRMWQMELNRRVGSGRLSELLGERAIPADRFLRRIGLRRAAEREVASLDDGEVKESIEAYTKGVNAAMRTIALPLELKILRVKPEPWTATDSLVWSKVMALSLCANWEGELVRGKVVKKIGAEKAAKIDLFYPEGVPVVVPPGTGSIAPSAAELEKLYEEAKPYLALGTVGSASNNWVVAGSRTASGSPILANDPHLKLTLPSVWYEAHMVAPGLDVYGATLASLPSIVLGHNRDVAWGFTNSFADVMDVYVEKFDPQNREQYEFEGKWEKAQIILETIKVKGGPDVVEEVMITRHGPVVAGKPLAANESPSNGKPYVPAPALALRWAALDVGHTTRAAMKLQRAKSAADVREALRDWHTPSQNVVFADKDNIGYVMAGVVPIRKQGSGLVPVPGWSGEWEWTGWVPFEELPQSWNPPAGYIATANNKVVGKDYKHHISWDYMNGYRVGRIEQMLKERARLTWEDCRDIQRDVFTQAGRDFARAVSPRIVPAGALETKAAALLAAFDGHATIESLGASVYEAMVLAFVRRALEPLLGKDLTEEVMGKTDNPLQPFGTMVGRYTSWAVRMATERPAGVLADGETWDGVTAGAFREAVATLARIAGPDPASWRWGELHSMKLDHPLASVKPLDRIFGSPDMPIGGDTDSPLQTALVPHVNYRADAWAPSWRHIVDFADVKQSRSVYPGGQSGHPGSAHYLDQLPLWYRGEFRRNLLDRSDIEAHLEGTLTLVPENNAS